MTEQPQELPHHCSEAVCGRTRAAWSDLLECHMCAKLFSLDILLFFVTPLLSSIAFLTKNKRLHSISGNAAAEV